MSVSLCRLLIGRSSLLKVSCASAYLANHHSRQLGKRELNWSGFGCQSLTLSLCCTSLTVWLDTGSPLVSGRELHLQPHLIPG